MKMKPVVVTLTLLLPLVLSLSLQEDDLVFDDVGEETSQASIIQSKDQITWKTKDYNNKNQHPTVERFWGIPNDVATFGHVFKLKIPKQAFSGTVDHYEVKWYSVFFIFLDICQCFSSNSPIQESFVYCLIDSHDLGPLNN